MNGPTSEIATNAIFPPTRYQGSKRKLAAAILHHLRELEFTTVLDAFGGTGAVAHAFKRAGKHVTYNDVLAFNQQIGIALIENDDVRLSDEDLRFIQQRNPDCDYDNFIERTFHGVYFTPEENRWLDLVSQNIPRLTCKFKRALAWFAVFQAAMIKRPYNLFHRSNLSMRLADVSRSFGNKTTWERAFPDLLHRFVLQANDAACPGGGRCRALCCDARDVEGEYDLVYIDTPYIKRNRAGTDYLSFYHFLEGMVDYASWPDRIDPKGKHFPLCAAADSRWSRADQAASAFSELFSRYSNSMICVSYRSDGIPTIDELQNLLRHCKSDVRVIALADYRYALSPNRSTQEMLLIAR